LELFDPATEEIEIWLVAAAVLAGAVTFSVLDRLVDETWGSDSGGGLLAAITLDGLPENLALGVSLIGAGPLGAAALSGSILLSNLPEAAGGAKQMRDDNRSVGAVVGLWSATAALLALAALIGYFFLEGIAPAWLAVIRCFAGGAVVASLATEVFPEAFREDGYAAGVATAIGAVLAIALDQLG
jgi:ZIP family zinc transporter